MSEIRVTYSGLIGLLIGLSTIVTGLIFTLIFTRNLSPEEFGTWGLIGGLITYVIIIEPIISYWSMREVARGIDSGRTAVLSSGLFSIIGVGIYLVIAYFVSESVGADPDILFFAALMIPFMFLNNTLSQISLGWKPHVNSFGVLTFDLVKITVALILVYSTGFGLREAILSLIVAYIVSIIVLSIFSRSKIRTNFNKDFLKNWLKRAWLPSYIKFPNMVVLDVLIFSILTGSVVGLAYWIAAFAIGTAIRHSSQITRAVYPKLLSGGIKEHLQENLVRLFYFVFPFMAITISFAKPGLFTLNPIYEVVSLTVVFITLRAFLKMLASVFTLAILGIEEVDKNKESTQKDYLKSKLFQIPTIRLLHRFVYLGSLGVGIFLLVQSNTSELDLVLYWSIIALVVQIPFTTYFYLMVRKQFLLSIDLVAVTKYLIISIVVFGGTYLLTEQFLVYQPKVSIFLPNLIPFVLLGISAYFGLTYLVDKRTRKLLKAIINEIKNR